MEIIHFFNMLKSLTTGLHVHGLFNALLAPLYAGAVVINLTI